MHFIFSLLHLEREKRTNHFRFWINFTYLISLADRKMSSGKWTIKNARPRVSNSWFPTNTYTYSFFFLSFFVRQESYYLHPNPRLPHMVNKVKLHYCQWNYMTSTRTFNDFFFKKVSNPIPIASESKIVNFGPRAAHFTC